MGTTVSPYDLYLGDIANLQGYRCRSLTRDSASFVAPRFSSGNEGQTDLDLLKSVSVDDLSGGMFQRDWKDSEKVARAIGMFNHTDQKLYPTVPRSGASAIGAGYYPTAKIEGSMLSFIAYGAFSANTYYNLLYAITPSGGVVNVPLPAALATNALNNISGMTIHKKYLFVFGSSAAGAGGGVNVQRYDTVAGVWQDVTGTLYLGCSIRGVLYGINYISDIFVVTNEDAAAVSYVKVDSAGSAHPNNIPSSFVEYNGAGWISKPDGIFRFDGVKAIKVLPLVTRALQVFNGALYFISGNWLYRFDGTNVIKLQFFGLTETGSAYGAALNLSSNSDYLFVSTVVLTTGYADSDKFSATASGLHRIYAYDGASFFMLHESEETLGTGYNPTIVTNGNPTAGLKLYDIFGNIVSDIWATYYYTFSLDKAFVASSVTANSKLEVTTSEHDAGFPNIFKAAELVNLDYTGMITGDSIVVAYQIFDGKTWGTWQSLGTITSTTPNTIEIPSTLPKLYRRIKVSAIATLASGSTLALKGVSLRYTLQPRMRWRWQTTILAEGNNSIEDRNFNKIAGDANAFTNHVLKSAKQKTPIFMLAPDYGKVKTQFNNAALTFIIKGQVPIYTDPYYEYPLVAVKNNAGVWEVLRVSAVSYVGGATDETTITVLERGYYGVTPGTVNADAEFHLCYKVYVTRLLRDAPSLDTNTYNEQDTSGESQLQREFLLELTEV